MTFKGDGLKEVVVRTAVMEALAELFGLSLDAITITAAAASRRLANVPAEETSSSDHDADVEITRQNHSNSCSKDITNNCKTMANSLVNSSASS